MPAQSRPKKNLALQVARAATLGGFGLVVSLQAQSAMRLEDRTIKTDSGKREWTMATPSGGLKGARPLVLVLHGHGGTSRNALGEGKAPSPLSDWLDIGEREDLVVAALQGSSEGDGKPGWNDCRGDAPGNPKTDDVDFARRVAKSLVDDGKVDPKRVYAMGMSNGGMMTYRLALEMRAPQLAAIAAVSSSMASKSLCNLSNVPVVSVLMINGTTDPIVPWAGGQVGGQKHARGGVIGAPATRDFWLKRNGLLGRLLGVLQFPKRSGNGTSAKREMYGANGGVQVGFITIEGGGHVEPSKTRNYGWLYSKLVGAQNKDLESAEEAWQFFRTKSAP
jgi:polyhydroxybutyrate depolymerase